MGNGQALSPGERAVAAAALMLGWLAALWLLTAIDGASPRCWYVDPDPPLVCEHGIQPRDPGSLVDVYPAAFLHFGRDHLAANSLPLLIFGFLAALHGIRRFLAICAVIVSASGLGIWLTSPDGSLTAGASGVVFGLFGYLLTRGFVERDAIGIAVGVVVLMCYGSLLWGALPTAADSGVSWQGHLFGLAGGVLAARWLRRPARTRTARLAGPAGV